MSLIARRFLTVRSLFQPERGHAHAFGAGEERGKEGTKGAIQEATGQIDVGVGWYDL